MKRILLIFMLLSLISGCSLTSMFSSGLMGTGLPELSEPAVDAN